MINGSVNLIHKIIYTVILCIFVFITPIVIIFKHPPPPHYKGYIEYTYLVLFLISLILLPNISINAIQDYTFIKDIDKFSKLFWIFALIFYTIYLLENIFISDNKIAIIIDVLYIILSISLVFNIPFITKLVSKPRFGMNTQWFILFMLCFIDILISLVHPLMNK